MAWNWYGVKTWYRVEARGRPTFTDEDYDANATLVEERVVIFKARTFDEAIRKAETEARKYAASIAYQNLYGQKVTLRYLESCNPYEMFDAPASGLEVYSNTEIFSKRVSDKALIDRLMPLNISKDECWKRMKFIDGGIARAMLTTLLEGINEDNLHPEVETGASVGNEDW